MNDILFLVGLPDWAWSVGGTGKSSIMLTPGLLDAPGDLNANYYNYN